MIVRVDRVLFSTATADALMVRAAPWPIDSSVLEVRSWATDAPQAEWVPGFSLMSHWAGNLRQQDDGTIRNLDPAQGFASAESAAVQVVATRGTKG